MLPVLIIRPGQRPLVSDSKANDSGAKSSPASEAPSADPIPTPDAPSPARMTEEVGKRRIGRWLLGEFASDEDLHFVRLFGMMLLPIVIAAAFLIFLQWIHPEAFFYNITPGR